MMKPTDAHLFNVASDIVISRQLNVVSPCEEMCKDIFVAHPESKSFTVDEMFFLLKNHALEFGKQ